MEWLIIAWFAVVMAGPVTADHRAKKKIKALEAQVSDCQKSVK